jgi:MoxR-like ATPase
MGERQVTADGKSRALDPLFTVLATQNPVEHEGTFPLPEAQLDRFLMKVVIPYPARDAELAVLELHESGFDPERGDRAAIVDAVITADEARACRTLVDGVRVAPEVREYIATITRATRDDPSLLLGASPRATVALMRAARAAAIFEDRDYVTPDDVKARALSVLRHRVTLAPELEIEGRTTDDVLSAVLTRTVAPA